MVKHYLHFINILALLVILQKSYKPWYIRKVVKSEESWCSCLSTSGVTAIKATARWLFYLAETEKFIFLVKGQIKIVLPLAAF